MQKMSASSEPVERLLLEHVTRHPCWQRLAEESPDIWQAVRATLLAPGKRLRPRLFLLAAEGYGLTPLPALAPVAVALELAHAFVLTHDDLVDRSRTRRGGPALAARCDAAIAAHPPRAFTGGDVALLAGDLLYTLALDTLLDAAAPERVRLDALRAFTRAAQITALGALREIELARLPLEQVTHEALLHAYRLKTACYTFALPLQLAALFAERREALAAPIAAFADAAGVAFQLANDLDAIDPWVRGGPVPDDIRDRRLTPALLHVWQRAGAADRGRLMAGDADVARRLFAAAGAAAWLRARGGEHAGEASRAAAALGLSAAAAAQVRQILTSPLA